LSNLTQRFITGFFGVSIMVGCILWNATSFCLLMLFISLVSLNEFYHLTEKNGIRPQKYLGLITGACLFFAVSIFSNFIFHSGFNVQLLFIPLAFSIFMAELYRRTQNPFNNIAWTLLGIFYIPFSLALFTWLPVYSIHELYQPHIVLGYFIILWVDDTGAYFAGKSLGRRKLFERHSPKKTWEGTFGGIASAYLVTLIVAHFFTDLTLLQWCLITAIIIVTGTLGDLVESMFKRSISLKDSGAILPGHGGFLDRFDGVFISAPFVFTYLKLFP
jgi:phosphatidate cytidylyltransferase